MKALAIITARGGSKRIPRKNIKEFCGKPIMNYSIEAALNSSVFDTVMVSTDDKEIAEIAIKANAEVPFFRSEKTSDDFATTTDVLMEVLEEYEKRGCHYDVACCIYPTAPFVTPERLAESVKLLDKTGADTAVPVVQFSYPPGRSLVMKNERLSFKNPENLIVRSQDLEKEYHDAGQFYTFRTDAFKRNKNLWIGDIVPIELSEIEVQDIDTEVDWKLAELKYQLLRGEN